MSKADDFGVPDVDIVAAAEEAGEIGAGEVPAAPCRPDICLAEDAMGGMADLTQADKYKGNFQTSAMSSSNPAARTPQNKAPASPPSNLPQIRCTKKGLPCEYMAVDADDSTPSQSPQLCPIRPTILRRTFARPTHPAPAHLSSAASNDFSRGVGMALPLPYTGPPPVHGRPRYSGAQYPNLSLSGSESSHSTPQAQYYPTQASNQMANQRLCQAYQYLTDHPPPQVNSTQYCGDVPGAKGFFGRRPGNDAHRLG
ncbi:hypothetical protein DFH08DRAFT_972500 [Mycena albidolilacea]|uniref:Uncharacterized protein n=1 Tax=Mycena albidolilacea TaxID=1033008 RepID=A0AAD7EDI8_9AGAR|nr:hypothetical protein DFH08DRAFT_972500 [Mycena albidolilacea]